jgi:uroporphyrin-III C-methyltransferase
VERGKVYIIGAGPGDWELITLKGLKIIKSADAILYDFLSSRKLLRFAKKSAQAICCGKSDGLHILEQKEINQLLYKLANQGKIVARLKGGDPLVFSRGIEEALYLKSKGIDLEIIQGITSAFSAPESFGIPLTRKGKYSSIAVLTGRKSNKDKLDAPKCDTLIYLMAVANIRNVIKALKGSGRGEDTPCAFIERGTAKEERIVTGTISNIVSKAQKHQVKPPAVFIVGEVVKYGRKIYGHKFK